MNWMCVCRRSSNTFLYTAIRASDSLLISRIISKFHRLSGYAFSVKTHQLTWTLSLRRNFEIHSTTITCNTWQVKPLQSPIPRIPRLTVSITFYRETSHRDYRESSRNNWLYAYVVIIRPHQFFLGGGPLAKMKKSACAEIFSLSRHWKPLKYR